MHIGFWYANLSEEYLLKDLGVDGRIVLDWMFKKLEKSIDWFDLA